MVACGPEGPDAPLTESGQTPGGGGAQSEKKSALTSNTFDPRLTMGPNCNTWWIEVYVGDPAAVSVQAEIDGEAPFELPIMSWGAFATSRHIPDGTLLRLTVMREDGMAATSELFAYLTGDPAFVLAPETSGTSSLPAYDPGLRIGENSNQWWIEVYSADARTIEVSAETEEGGRIALNQTSWGSFAASHRLKAGTPVRLVARRDDDSRARTLFFVYLREFPVLDAPAEPIQTPQTPSIDTPPEPETRDTYYVDGRHLYDPCGNQVILRGVNKMNIWTDRDGLPSFPEIAKTGANTVRIVWGTSGSAEELDTVISNALLHDLLPMVELHNATGNFPALQTLVDYWVSTEVSEVLRKYERQLLVNIGNEVGDWSVTAQQFRDGYELAVRRMRDAGFLMPLVIDSRGWGHDIRFLIDNGPYLQARDTESNLIFSTHQYDPAATAAYFVTEFADAAAIDLPLVIGEFGDNAFDCTSPVDYRSLIEAAAVYDIGWYAWSWGRGNTPCSSLDMSSDGTFAGLHGWGLEVATTHPDSIKNTAAPIASLGYADCRYGAGSAPD